MRGRTVSALIGALALCSASTARAHEGHGDPALANSMLHYLVEPAHLVVTLGLLLALALGWWFRRLRREGRLRRR